MVYIGVDEIDHAIAKIRDAGGTLVTEKLPIPAMGWTARFRDSEGNLIGLFQMDPTVAVNEGGAD